MGAWDAGSFGNDDAMDWLAEFEEKPMDAIRTAIAVVIESDENDYLDAPDCCIALAAVECVAAALGKPPKDFPDEAAETLAARPITPDLNLLKHARRTVEQILGKNSELKELWDESENPDEWYQVINDLKARLGLDQ